jgi:DNA-binding transcriptional MerR regulator
MKTKMRIGELAGQAGVTPRTIRYYEDLGLLGPCEREGHGFRYYSEAELTRLQKIDALKQLGLTLDEIAEVIPLYCEDPTGLLGKRRVLEILEEQLSETDEKIAALQRFRSDIQSNITKIRAFIERTQTE